MFFVQTQYWYLLVVGFLVFCVLYLCLVEIWYFFLKWSKARLCHAHSEANRYRKERKQETCTDNSNGSEVSYHGSREEVDCRDCKYTRRQLSMEMSVRFVGFIHFSICTVMSYWIIQETKHDVMNAKSRVVIPFVQFSITYFVYDILAMYTSFSARLQVMDRPLKAKIVGFFETRPSLIIHHILIVIIGYPFAVNYSWRNNFGDFFLGCLSIGEASSHFLSTTYILRLLKWENSILFLINGFLFLVSFFVFRILVIPYMYVQYFEQQSTLWRESLWRIPVICHLGMLTVISFQTYWFFLIVKKVYKIVYLIKQKHG